ncbi:hypothetical protein ACFVUS_07770 [Nocardia sp. NPDC058058]|uniref:hypothetical protein n=1 Tax=Nocardia sp. NPDC058058 TaxID=3346317 RepID=UPI0036DEB30D
MRTLGVAMSFGAAMVMGLCASSVAGAYPNQYEGLPVGGCAYWDQASNTAGPADCDTPLAKYRLIEQVQLTPETQELDCGPEATFRYRHRTADGYRLALYCFTYNMTVDSCWDLTDTKNPYRLDCAARQPNSERITQVFNDVYPDNPCSSPAVIYDRVKLTICVVPNS